MGIHQNNFARHRKFIIKVVTAIFNREYAFVYTNNAYIYFIAIQVYLRKIVHEKKNKDTKERSDSQ